MYLTSFQRRPHVFGFCINFAATEFVKVCKYCLIMYLLSDRPHNDVKSSSVKLCYQVLNITDIIFLCLYFLGVGICWLFFVLGF